MGDAPTELWFDDATETLPEGECRCPFGPWSVRSGFSWLLTALVAASALRAAAEDDLLVGRNAAGQLKLEIGFAQPFRLATIFPGVPGYATGEIGFHSAAFDDPDHDFFQLSPMADFRFVLLAKDPGIEVWNDHGSGFLAVGESFFMGTAPFDTHPFWNIVNGQPGRVYSLKLTVHDVNNLYADSLPFVLSFTPAPPVIAIATAAPGLVTLSWTPATPGFVLQFAPALWPAAWTNAPTGATNPITLPSPSPGGFYRVGR